MTQARDALSAADASLLDARDRLELLVGLGQALYLDSEFRAAAEVFTGAIDNAAVLGPQARDQLLDWWATALDRHAQTRPVTDRPPIYDRLVAQMEQELRKDAAAASASYWLAAGLRLRGDLERAWDAALAGWVRSLLTPDRGAALRPDLDELDARRHHPGSCPARHAGRPGGRPDAGDDAGGVGGVQEGVGRLGQDDTADPDWLPLRPQVRWQSRPFRAWRPSSSRRCPRPR